MSYWFAYQVFDESIDIHPGKLIIRGPFDKREIAKKEKMAIRALGSGFLISALYKADSEQAAKLQAKKEQMSRV